MITIVFFKDSNNRYKVKKNEFGSYEKGNLDVLLSTRWLVS